MWHLLPSAVVTELVAPGSGLEPEQETTPPSVEDARKQLEQARRWEKEQAKQLERDRREEEKRIRDFRASARPTVEAVRRQVDEAIAFAAERSPVVAAGPRSVVRGYLHGELQAPELMSAAQAAAQQEPGLNALLGAAQEAWRRGVYYSDPAGPGYLGPNASETAELDELERAAWQAFARRARAVAGED